VTGAGPWRVRGIGLVTGEPVDLYLSGGTISLDPVPGATDLSTDGFVGPGLVDAHCHVGIGPGSVGVDAATAREQARTERDAGVLLLRDAGVPVDTRFLDDEPGMPRIIRAGRHLALPKRYLRGLGPALDDESQLPDAVAEQARRGDGWVKLVGDWIDRDRGDLAPLWSAEILTEAIARAHAEGARVTAHVFSAEALPDLLDAGIDCIEHGTGLTDATIAQMARQKVALVPTSINIANFPSIADGADRFPVYAAHMRDLHARWPTTLAAAIEAGIDVYAGTDAGGFVAHGRIVDELDDLAAAGMGTAGALAAGSWRARRWLTGSPEDPLVDGAPADLVVYPADPRTDLAVLRTPSMVVLGGRPQPPGS